MSSSSSPPKKKPPVFAKNLKLPLSGQILTHPYTPTTTLISTLSPPTIIHATNLSTLQPHLRVTPLFKKNSTSVRRLDETTTPSISKPTTHASFIIHQHDHDKKNTAASCSSSNQQLLAVGYNDGLVKMYDFDTGRVIAETVVASVTETIPIVALEFTSEGLLTVITKGTRADGGGIIVSVFDCPCLGRSDEKGRMSKGENQPLLSRVSSLSEDDDAELISVHRLRLPTSANPTGASSSHGSYVAVGDDEGCVSIISIRRDDDCDTVAKEVLPSAVQSLTFSTAFEGGGEGVLLAAGLEDGEVALMDASTSTSETTPTFQPFYFLPSSSKTSPPPVTFLKFHRETSNRSLLLAIGGGSSVRIMDGATFEVFFKYDLATTGDGETTTLTSLSFVKRNIVMVGRSKGGVEFVGFKEWDWAVKGSITHDYEINSISFAGDSKLLAVGGEGITSLYKKSSWFNKSSIPLASSIRPCQIISSENVTIVTFSPDSQFLAVACEGSKIMLYDASDTDHVKEISDIDVDHPVTAMNFSSESQYLAIGDESGTCTLVAVPTMQQQSTLFVKGAASAITWSPDGLVLAVAGREEQKVHLYDTSAFEQLKDQESISLSAGYATSLAFDSTSNILAVAAHKTIMLVGFSPGEPWRIKRRILVSSPTTTLQFSPCDSILAASTPTHCHIYSLTSYTLLQAIPTSTTHLSFSFNTLAVASSRQLSLLSVGELLNDDWFPLFSSGGEDNKTPQSMCETLHQLDPIERAQLIYHNEMGDDDDTNGGDTTFPLEKRIDMVLTQIRKNNATGRLGSERMTALLPTEELTTFLSELFSQFPKAIFATHPHHSPFEIGLTRSDPRLTRLVFNVALIFCRSYPYILMNDDMRSGALTRALILACETYPDVVVGVLKNMVLWPVNSWRSKGLWKTIGGEAICKVGYGPRDFERVFEEEMKLAEGGSLARPMVLPVPYLARVDCLSALVRCCSEEVMESDEMGLIIQEIWDNEIKWWFVLDFILYFIFFMVWGSLVTATNVSSSDISFGGDELTKPTMILWIIVFFLNAFFGLRELRQFRSTYAREWNRQHTVIEVLKDKVTKLQDGLKQSGDKLVKKPVKWTWEISEAFLGYFEDYWNISDMLTFIMVNVTLALLVWRDSVTVECTVITSFFILMNLISYLRGFESSGWLVNVLYQNMIDSTGFIVVIGILLLGFAIMFRILLGPFDEDYSSYQEAVFSMFDVGIVGDFDRAIFNESQNPIMTMMLFIVFCITVTIVAMNGYIALLGDSYSGVQEHAEATKRMQMARMIADYLEYSSLDTRNQIANERKYFFALVPVDHEDVVAADDATRARLTNTKIKAKTDMAATTVKTTTTADGGKPSVARKGIEAELAATKKTLDEILKRLDQMEKEKTTIVASHD